MFNKFRVHFLKTYWSDCVLLEYKGKYALVDTGSINDKEYIVNYLNDLNIKELEFVLITHFHCDHYGCLNHIINKLNVKSVYIKEYSALDNTKANGQLADDSYRKEELNKYNNLVNSCKNKKNYKNLENIQQIFFDDVVINLFNNKNVLKCIYEDKESKHYHEYKYNENFNSLSLYFEINGNSIYLSGDLIDEEFEDYAASFLNYNVCKNINKKIDIYKASHHGMDNGTCIKTLEIISPKNVVVTNHKEDLINNTNISNYVEGNDANIYYTYDTIIFEVNSKGKIEVQK